MTFLKLAAFPLRSLRLCGKDPGSDIFNRRDAENAEEAQRRTIS